MQLTLYTDYSLRVLLFLGQHPNERVTISRISEYFGISRNHLVKVVHNLGQLDLIQTVRGKSGGILLVKDPKTINLAAVIQRIEPHMNLLECFDDKTNTCPITTACELKHILHEAKNGFLDVLEGYTLADLLPENKVIPIISTPLDDSRSVKANASRS